MDRFFNGVNFVEENLFEVLNLEVIAKESALSMFYFSRMFRAIAGESVMSYVKRRRLSEIAVRVSSTDDRLIDIAMDCRFESQEAFSRAFKKMFKISPGEYRKLNDPVRLIMRKRITPEKINHLKEGVGMEPKIVERGHFFVVGLRDKFVQDETSSIPQLWDKFVSRVNEIKGIVPNVMYGVCQCEEQHEGEFLYTAGIEVTSKSDEMPEEMVLIDIPTQQYALFTHKVKNKDLSKDINGTLEYIWSTWLPSSKYKYTGTPDFELYDDRFNPVDMSGEFDIYIPIVKK